MLLLILPYYELHVPAVTASYTEFISHIPDPVLLPAGATATVNTVGGVGGAGKAVPGGNAFGDGGVAYAGGGGGGGHADAPHQSAGGTGGGGAGASNNSTNAVAGTANTGGGGGGGGGGGTKVGAAGGSGVIIVKEDAGANVGSGIWDLNTVYDAVKAGTWSS